MGARSIGESFGLMLVALALGCGDDGPGSISTNVAGGGSDRPDGGTRPSSGPTGRPPGGSVGGSSTAPIPASLSRGDLLSELTAPELSELCSSLDTAVTSAVSDAELERLSCTLFALFTSVSSDVSGDLVVNRAACDQAVSDCLGSGGTVTTSSSCEGSGVPGRAAGCDATVGDLADCIDAQARELARAVDSFSCAAFSNPAVIADALAGPMSGAACMAIEAECPALLDTGGGSSSGETPPASGCENTCPFRDDNECDDGGPGMVTDFCVLGSDCLDCGPR